jgi:SAM-dependent methyltransferase
MIPKTNSINDYQKGKFLSAEKYRAEDIVKRYSNVLAEYSNKDDLKILDIGGGGGVTSSLIYDFFRGKANITLLDNTEYDTWGELSDKITFLKASIFDADCRFINKKYDIIFINLVLHHLVDGNYKSSRNLQRQALEQAKGLLSENGVICVTEDIANSYMSDFSTWMIFKLTSMSTPLIAKVLRKLDAKSSGVGVCFLSDKTWRKTFSKLCLDVKYSTVGDRRKLKWHYSLCLLLRSYYFRNIYVLHSTNK